MRSTIVLCLLVMVVLCGGVENSAAQVITTVAGNGVSGFSGDGGAATAAAIGNPAGCEIDKYGSLYIVSGFGGHRIRKVTSSGAISTIAGTGVAGYSGDGGQATAAKLNTPQEVAIDTVGNIYLSEGTNCTIRKINALTGIITTIAGNGSSGYYGDGAMATNAILNDPLGICLDKFGNLYIADNQNNRIRKIDATGVITTFAGDGSYGFSGDGGPATLAQLWVPWSVTADDTGNIYISDRGNFRIRKVSLAGTITTYAGNGAGAFIGDGMAATNAQFTPVVIRMDSSNTLFISDMVNRRVYKVDINRRFYLVAGSGGTGFSGDGGPATAANIDYPGGLAFDRCENLYMTDVANRRIRKVAFNPTCVLPTLNTNPLYTIPELSLSPNPATNAFTLTSSTLLVAISITTLTGQEVLAVPCSGAKAEVNIAQLPAGLYLLRATDVEGRKVVRRFLKE